MFPLSSVDEPRASSAPLPEKPPVPEEDGATGKAMAYESEARHTARPTVRTSVVRVTVSLRRLPIPDRTAPVPHADHNGCGAPLRC